jgi:hypothetical protein
MAARKLVQRVSQRPGSLFRKDSSGAMVQFRTDRVAKVHGEPGSLRRSSLEAGSAGDRGNSRSAPELGMDQ